MRYRSFVVTALAATLLMSACKSDPPPPPAPTGPTAEEIAQARADSLTAVRAEEARVRAEAEAARRAAAEEAAARRALEAARTALTTNVYFDYDMAVIRPDAERVLRGKMEILRNSPRVRIQVEGHADERGSNEYNIALGNRRAQAVVDFFTNFGLDGNRFSIVSYGEEQPAAMGSNERAWSQNRRAEFNITAGQNDINPGQTP
jgi:peptidoglycan-associated lipoprotein